VNWELIYSPPFIPCLMPSPVLNHLVRALRPFAVEAAVHAVALVLALLSIWIVHLVLTLLFGADARLLEVVPIRYVTEAADLVVLLQFLGILGLLSFKRLRTAAKDL
jgi:hypothetical protein